jgi:cell wall-associated NlpC family hydrolase
MKKTWTTLFLLPALLAGSLTFGAQDAAAASTGTIVSSVNFRTGPNVDSSRIRYLEKGEKVQIIDEVNAYWYKVKDSKGKTGYISTADKYVNVSGGSTPPANTSSNASKVISAAKKYMGTPYEFGSDRSNTRTFDCSDFVRQAFKDALGITLPSDSRQQGSYVKSKGNAKTSWSSLKPGDLMFFMEYRGTSKSLYSGVNKSKQRITHVGIYLGDGKMINTYSNESGGVRIDTIDNKHWEYRFLYGGSAL